MTREEAVEAILSPKGPPTDPVEKRAFEQLLERDADLRRMQEQQSALFNALDDWTTPGPSAAFDGRMEALIEMERNREPRWLGFIRPVLTPRWAVAAALGTILAVAALVSQGPTPNHNDQATKTAVVLQPGDVDDVDEWDRALDDLEMLTEFDVLPPPAAEGKS